MKSCFTAVLCCMAMLLPASIARADHNEITKAMQSPKDSKEFAMRAAEGGMLEVQLSQLAQEKAQSDQVKQLAKQIQQDHQMADEQLMTLAKQQGITLPTELNEHQKDTLLAFKQLSGEDFDRAYVLFNITGHLKSVSMYQNEAQTGTDPQIKQWAAQTLPKLREHTAMVGRTAVAVGIPIDALTGSGTAAGNPNESAQPAGSRQEPNTGK